MSASGEAGGSLDRESVGEAYHRLSDFYDILFYRIFDGGRKQLFRRLPAAERIDLLEVGIGTGLSIPYYAPAWRVTGVDFSPSMLRKAVERRRELAAERQVRLLQMDATHMAFRDGSFDAAIAVYVISATPDPLKVLHEMKRVVRPGGTLLLLNHFLSESRTVARVERRISPWCAPVGFRTDLALDPLLAAAGLTARSKRKLNLGRLWTLVECRVETGTPSSAPEEPGHAPPRAPAPHHEARGSTGFPHDPRASRTDRNRQARQAW